MYTEEAVMKVCAERDRLREQVAKLRQFVEHEGQCVLAHWCGGRPTDDGGYESCYGGKWYETKPVDRSPQCTCGLADVLAATEPWP